MPNNLRWIRWIVVATCVLLMLIPSLLTASVWTTVNLEIVFVGIVGTMLVAIYLPRARWIGAVLTAILIAIPPFPYWIVIDESGRHIRPLYGFKINDLHIGFMLLLLIAALLLFAVIFWAVKRKPSTSQ